MSEPGGTETSATLRRIERAAGGLATASVARMDETLPWFRDLPADQRSWVMLVAQAGVRSLVQWLRQGGGATDRTQEVSDEVFAAAPQALARSISLQQTVALIKVTIDVVEEQVSELAVPGEEQSLREAVLRFSREIAFAAARVYARAAESRGSWDARLQALLVDALLRGDSPDVLASRAAALGWTDAPPVAVAVGRSPGGEVAAVLHTVYRQARRIGVEVIGGVHGDRLVIVLGGAADPVAATEKLRTAFGEGPVVVGPAVPSLDEATESARAALAGFRAAPAWPTAPCPVAAGRAAAGTRAGRRHRGPPPVAPRRVRGTGPVRRRAAGDARRVLRRRRHAGERGPGAVRAPEHRALPAEADRRGDRLLAAGPARRLRAAGRADCGYGSTRWYRAHGLRPAMDRPTQIVVCRFPPKVLVRFRAVRYSATRRYPSESYTCSPYSLPDRVRRSPASSRRGSTSPAPRRVCAGGRRWPGWT